MSIIVAWPHDADMASTPHDLLRERIMQPGAAESELGGESVCGLQPEETSVSVKDQQRRWVNELHARFGGECVVEWASFTGYPKQYSPRLDLAVGPFSTVPGEGRVGDYRRLAREHRGFLENLWACHVQNEAALNARNDQSASTLETALAANRNARCFLAIEIENQVSRKHLMGGALNAVALGHLGIIVGWTEDKVRAMFRARNYLQFLERVEKPTISMDNLLILSREQALRAFQPG